MKKHDRKIKIALIILTLAALSLALKIEIAAQREHDAQWEESNRRFAEDEAKNGPYYKCIIAAMAAVDENSTDAENHAAVAAADRCKEKYMPQ